MVEIDYYYYIIFFDSFTKQLNFMPECISLTFPISQKPSKTKKKLYYTQLKVSVDKGKLKVYFPTNLFITNHHKMLVRPSSI